MAQKDASWSYPQALLHPCSVRLYLLLLILAGYTLTAYMRSNLGFTITCMINSTALAAQYPENSTDVMESVGTIPAECTKGGLTKKQVNDYGGSLLWSHAEQNLIFEGTFWGSLLTILPSGYIADRTSPKIVFLSGFLMYVLCSAAFPWIVINLGFKAAFISRFIMGIGEGLVLPTINALIPSWYPTNERSTAASIYTSGNQLAGLLGSILAAYLCASSWQWPSVFYFCALAGLIWSALWCYFVTDSPATCKCIGADEKRYLKENVDLKPKEQPISVPWKKMFMSAPVWAIIVCHCFTNFVLVLMQSYTPTYFKEILFLKIQDNGLFSALPNLFQCFPKVFWGALMDRLKQKRILSATTACKISQLFSNFGMTASLLCLAYLVDCRSPVLALILMCCWGVAFSTTVSGYYTSLLCVAPRFAGTLCSMANVFGIVGRIAAPDLVMRIKVHGSIDEWKLIFVILAATSAFSGIVFAVFGSARVQRWAVDERVAQEVLLGNHADGSLAKNEKKKNDSKE